MRSGTSWVWGQTLVIVVRWITFVVPIFVVISYFGFLPSILAVTAATGLHVAGLLLVLRTAHTVEVDAEDNAVFQSALGRMTVPVRSIRRIGPRPNPIETIVEHAGGRVRVRPEAPGLLVLAERIRMAEISGEAGPSPTPDATGQ